MNVRLETEKIELQILSPYAAKSAQSAGRAREEAPCPIRTCYQRDRDRILHSKAFRRLKHKTQVFLSPKGDHYRTRLTHTLEVSQIARTIGRALRLNEDLIDAIALGHDLGHTPFGHAGERALDEISQNGFTHYMQSVRVVTVLERDYKGLNLTKEVIDGIATHTKGRWASTLEGKVVRYSDRIAYVNHDIEDAITAGILTEEDLPFDTKYILGMNKSQRISSLISSMVENSTGKDDIQIGEKEKKVFDQLWEFMFESVYKNPLAKGEETKVLGLIQGLYEYFAHNPEKLPQEYAQRIEIDSLETVLIDYIAGMTDGYAVSLFQDIFIPKSWQGLSI